MTLPELEKIASTLERFPFPKKITFEVCSACNLKCPMCYQPDMRRQKGVMPLELWRKCAEEIAATAPKTECWFSFCGEPLLEPDLLLQILSYGKSLGLESLNLNTNGVLLEPALVDPILDSGVDVVVFGVDGLTKATYEAIRVGGDRDALYANIEHFLVKRLTRGGGPEVQVQFIEMDENESELEAFKEYWIAKGAVVKVRRKLSWGGRIETPLDIPEDARIPCPWAITVMHVFWDGRISRCPGDTEGEECVGSVWEESLSQLWRRLGTHRQLHLARRFDALPERCQQCDDWMVGAAEKIRSSPRQAKSERG